ncbi:DJ-1/PfpI family protein [Phenylobacterium sp.]|jgi:transcriptional regulator GlxA family with amidase domain|uniref:DJ-1/PfpI family protein n=1 Tax=Phenylobacterium sp. TaxID=1871053 RepID=UPI00378366C8
MRKTTTGPTLSRRGALLLAAGAAAPAAAQTPPAPRAEPPKPKKLGIVLFPRFETLDVFGPVEMWGRLREYELVTVSEHGGPVVSSQGVETVARYAFATAPRLDILMVPGGVGVRTQVGNPVMLDFLRRQDRQSEWTMSVCTGAALLARAGLLDGRKATTNKRSYPWVITQSDAVRWQGRARWVEDGKYITSSGVSAGTDMALSLVERLDGRAAAEEMADYAEYVWNSDPHNDPFAIGG